MTELIQYRLRKTIRDHYRRSFAAVLDKALAVCHSGSEQFSFLGPSCVLFHTQGANWIVDSSFRLALTEAERDLHLDRLDALFAGIDYAFISHEHPDHFDPFLVERFRDIRWFIPDFMEGRCIQPADHIFFIHAGDELALNGLRVSVYPGQHYDRGTSIGVNEYGFLFHTAEQRIMMPGDVRDYDCSLFPDFENVTHFFLNVWLGRDSALRVEETNYPELVADFVTHWKPQNVIMGHLLEVSRDVDNLWSYRHAGLLMDAIVSLQPDCDLRILRPGQSSLL